MNSIPLDGSGVVVRVGRYGPYLQRAGEGARLRPRGSRAGRADPGEGRGAAVGAVRRPRRSARPLTAARSRRGPGATARTSPTARSPRRCSSRCRWTRSRLADAEKLLTLPRTVGEIDGVEVTAQNGRYGPYLKKGTDSRSIESEDQLFTVTLDQAKEIFAQPKQRGRRAAAAPPLKELGNDPVSGKAMVVKDGRFGPVRHRRRDQRVAAPWRLGRGADRRARRRTARRPPLARTGEEGTAQGREEGAREESGGEANGEEGRRQEVA